MTEKEQKAAAKDFVGKWAGHGNEKSETHSFWIDLLEHVFGVEDYAQFLDFEKAVKIDGATKFIDAYLPSTKVIVEQKSADVKLDKAYHQSGGAELTPYEQAKRYDDNLPYKEKARWIVVCNFATFLIFDMNKPGQPPEELLLENLPKEYHRLNFLVDETSAAIAREMQISLEAGDIVRVLYDRLLPRYLHPEAPETLKSLNKLCVRIVFCLYAEDAGLFGKHSAFHDYLTQYDARHLRQALIELFKVLDTPVPRRDPYLEPELAAFPYVNGGLFADENIEIPQFDDELKELLLARASDGFDWSAISPTIFGAVFESTLNPETRRSGGMHYTSIENIHKVIDPLFLDGLKAELAAACAVSVATTRRKRLLEFIDRIASLHFLDPACGSGNFLTETFLSLRRLENEALKVLNQGQMLLDVGNDVIKVSIRQFHGIEINDFAVAVAKTALWIAESQMFHETEEFMHSSMEFLPLKSYDGIAEGNALRMDWNSVAPRENLHYIIGNPPFIGARLMAAEQKNDMLSIFGAKWQNVGNLDYVCGWYQKAAEMMQGTAIRTALVSTNSITQGEQVADLWKGLMQMYGIHIDFAHRTFRWDSEAAIKAHVHCVIIGFSCAPNPSAPRLFDKGAVTTAKNINPYLLDAENVFIDSRSKPLCDVPEIGIGNKPIDNGNYLFLPEEKEEFLKKEPAAEKYFHPWYGSQEFINNKPRWCLWLGECSPAELRSMPRCMERVANVREFRLASKSEGTRKLADKPTRFHVENMPKENYMIIPRHSSEVRHYMPMGLMSQDILCGDANLMIPSATLYHFGVLTSLVHNAWMRVVCGRLEMRYRYSKDIVYNNFPWPEATDEQKKRIEAAAQGILDARAKYPDSSLADLYDPLVMPQELRKAHHDNDHAVMDAYGYPRDLAESDIVADLFQRYRKLCRA